MEKQIEPLPFFKDRFVLILVIANGVLIVLNVLTTLIRLRTNDFKVPVQYLVSDGSILQSSSWYTLYSLALFVLAGGILTILAAYRLHHGNRIFSLTVLVLYLLVGIVSFLVINALLSLVARV